MPTVSELKEAVEVASKIESLKVRLSTLLGVSSKHSSNHQPKSSKKVKEAAVHKKHKLSEKGRANIIAAQKARWAKKKKS